MRQVVLFLGTALIFATTAAAQSTSSSTTQTDSAVNPTFTATLVDFGDFRTTDTTTITTTPSPAPAAAASLELFASQPTFSGPDTGFTGLVPYSFAAGSPADSKPQVYGVFKPYPLRLSVEYSFLRMYVSSKPSVTENMNGFDLGANYFFHGGWIGADADFMLEFGTLFTNTSHFAFIGGGPRFRWAGPENIEVWGHALVGFSHLAPRTAFGNMGSFAYEAGGGVDLGSRNSRIAYRVQADLIGTTFFGTYQFSPRIAAGIVFKF